MKPWRTLLYSARTSHCLAWNLDNHNTSTGTRNRRNHRGSSLATYVVAAAYMQVESAMLDQLNDKPYMHSNSPRPAVEDSEQPTDDDSDDEDKGFAPPSIDDEPEDENDDPPPLMEDDDSDDEPNDDSVPDEQLGAQSERDDYGQPPHPNTIVLPVETRPIEELQDGARRTTSRKRMRPQSFINESYSEGETTWEENGELVRGINIIEQINAHMQTDDNDNEARIVSIYHMLTMHDPEILSVPEDDENNENISTRDALKAPDAEQFKEAIREEVWDLTKGTGTLVPVSTEEVKAMKKYWQIGTTLKCKRKKKGNGLPDK